ncbi:hypothetical protein J2T12_004925 [Paenibacillus anaericanus]|nr:hypothetical protein [Paenibacillus anaericanus]
MVGYTSKDDNIVIDLYNYIHFRDDEIVSAHLME